MRTLQYGSINKNKTNKLCILRKGRNNGRLSGLGVRVSVTKKWI